MNESFTMLLGGAADDIQINQLLGRGQTVFIKGGGGCTIPGAGRPIRRHDQSRQGSKTAADQSQRLREGPGGVR